MGVQWLLPLLYFTGSGQQAAAADCQDNGPCKCVQYSWLGTDSIQHYSFQKSELLRDAGDLSLYNRSCEDFPKIWKKPKPIPCISPYLVPATGVELPSGTVVNNIFGDAVHCNPGKGDICAVVVFFFNNEVVNLTAYCTRVTVDGSEPMTEGCISTHKAGYLNLVCVSQPKAYPTNTYIPSPNSSPGTVTNRLFLQVTWEIVFFLVLMQNYH